MPESRSTRKINPTTSAGVVGLSSMIRRIAICVSANLFPLDGISGAKPSVYMWGRARTT
jgi:hypothetical protein